MVAERSVNLRNFIEKYCWEIRIENVGMSSDKLCEKHSRLKSKVSKTRLIRFGKSYSVSKSLSESFAW